MMTQVSRQVPFNVLGPGVQAIRAELDAALQRVLDRGWFLMGPELKAFEQRTSDQVLVYVDKKVPDGTTLEESVTEEHP